MYEMLLNYTLKKVKMTNIMLDVFYQNKSLKTLIVEPKSDQAGTWGQRNCSSSGMGFGLYFGGQNLRSPSIAEKNQLRENLPGKTVFKGTMRKARKTGGKLNGFIRSHHFM
jgi:hypothetical protein